MRMRLLKQNEAQHNAVARPIPPADSAPAFISSNMSVNGTMTGNVDVTIDGHVQGEIRGRSISIGENAEVEASLTNSDLLERSGSGFVGRHGSDLAAGNRNTDPSSQ